jgi:hypothetical protein
LRPRNKKPGAVSRPGGWRTFGEYAFLEDSRYTSQEDFEGNFDVAEFLAFLTRDKAVCVESTGPRKRKKVLAGFSVVTPAKAGGPVTTRLSVMTGCPAFAGHDRRGARDAI